MDTLYKQELLDHYKHPRNQGPLEDAAMVTVEYNPSCGDSVQLFGAIKEGMLEKLTFIGKGCVISQAAASMLTVYCTQKKITDLCMLTHNDMLNLVGITLGPTRLKCALLPLFALQNGLQQYKG